MDINRVVIILRGVSGGGKSTFANYLECMMDDRYDSVVCSADDYYILKYGSYQWNAEEIGKAHEYCRHKFEVSLIDGYNLVIVANTNTAEKEFSWYKETAEKYSYNVFSLIVENRHGGINQHDVPEQTLNKQAQNIRNSLKLL